MNELSLVKDLRRSLTAGHPWVYDGALAGRSAALRPGELVRLRDQQGPLALGYADPGSPIRVRVLSTDAAADPDDPAWAARRAARAAGLRRADRRLGDTSALRLVHGEGDFMPGLVIDLYATTAVVQCDGAGAAAFWGPRLDAVADGLRAGGFAMDRIWQRERGRPGRGRALLGGEPRSITVHEGAARYEVDVRWGQKTGLFLDQRENRAYAGKLADGRDVLNLFGYTGGFSIHAALGGARRVVTVDSAPGAIAAAARNLELSGLDRSRHELVVADAFAYLAEASGAGRRFDLVVCDPPSFAPRVDAMPAAGAAYRRLNALALSVVAPGGLLLTSSCSSHFSRHDLTTAVAEAACDTGRGVLVRASRGAAGDHPVLPAFPEGDYLKLLDCSVA